MLIIPRKWKPAAALVAAGALSFGLLSPALAQEVTNQPPAPMDDTATTAAGTAVDIDVLANDADPDGQSISLTEWTQGANGAVEVNEAIFTYTPTEGFTGDDTFTYTVTDGEETATATVTVTVEEAAVEGPQAADDTATTTAGTAVEIDVLANDTGDEGATLAIEGVTAPANGTAEVLEGVVVYTPAEGFTGDDTFEYTLTDGTNTDTATVTVTVEEAVAEGPEATDDVAATTAGTAVEIDVLANDTGDEGATLAIEGVTAPASGGTAEVVEGVVVYTPAEGFTGDDTFEYTLTDGTNTDTATVTVTVEEAVAEGPEATDDVATTTAGTAVEIDVLANDTGDEGATLAIEGVTAPANGTAEVLEGVVVYTPAEGFTGDDTFEYTLTDGTNTDTATVTVTVEAAPPSENLDPAIVEACQTYTGDDASLKLLCRVYMADRLSPFVQRIVGSIILLTMPEPEPEPDPVLVACEANAGDATVDALCDLYQNEAVPEWIRTEVGNWILELTAPAPPENGDDTNGDDTNGEETVEE